MATIICACTGNICRSPMAERLLQQALQAAGLSHRVISAGVAAYDGQPASSFSVQALAPLGLDLSDHRSQMITPQLLSSAALVLVMTQMHLLTIREDYPQNQTPVRLWREAFSHSPQVADPYGGDYAAYQYSLESIQEAIPYWVEYIKKNVS